MSAPPGGQQVEELEAPVEALARGQGHLHLGTELAPGGDVLGAQRLLVEVGVERRQRVGQLQGTDGLEDPGMRVERELPVLRGARAQLREVGGGRVAYPAPAFGVGVEPVGTGLEHREAPLLVQAPGLLGRLPAVGAADPVVDPYPVARRAAQQAVHRQPRGLAGDVPQGVVERGDGRQPDAARREAELLMDFQHQVLDAARVLAAHQREQVVGDGRRAQVGAGGVDLAPAVDALVGRNLEQDARAGLEPGQVAGDAGDFHGAVDTTATGAA